MGPMPAGCLFSNGNANGGSGNQNGNEGNTGPRQPQLMTETGNTSIHQPLMGMGQPSSMPV